uniref:F-box domain-containing protein n=1 Tax=Brassica oleracea TaxID=3712 RepID=A0A3P6DAY7_BRAOL|nr:unnamed protein product [Brassica oleracea]
MEGSKRSLSRRLRREQDHADNHTTTIPFDLIIEILSFLPAKSLILLQSVSKLWFSTIRTKNFIDLFLARSKTRPRLLLPFMHVESKKRFILSAPEHNKEEDKSASTVTLRHDMTILDPVYYIISRPVNGLICCIRDSSISVCNPATRQIVKLPDDVTCNGGDMYARLGYDPVEDQYKVLCVMIAKFNSFGPYGQDIRQEHLVCTVTSSEKQEWRKIENTTIDSYLIISGGICIDGAIYYEIGQSRIVRFDVRTETITIIKAPEESDFSTMFPSTLLNYKGRLGGVDYKNVMRLWILEDAEKQEWSSMTCEFPSELKCLLGSYVVSTGDIHNGELMVFHPWSWSLKPFCFCYYDFKKESIIRKVEIKVDGEFRRIHGIGEKTCQMLCYPGYFENIRFL